MIVNFVGPFELKYLISYISISPDLYICIVMIYLTSKIHVQTYILKHIKEWKTVRRFPSALCFQHLFYTPGWRTTPGGGRTIPTIRHS